MNVFFLQVPCIIAGCNELVLRCQLPRHVEKECKYRGVQCLYCNSLVPEIFLETEHFDKCLKYLLDCDNGCGAKDIPRERMDEHKHIECPLEVKLCPFHQLGCDFKDTKDQIEEHMNDSLQKHLLLAVESAEKSYFLLQELELKTAGLQESNRLLESYVESQKDALATAHGTLSTQQIKLNTVEKFLQEQKKILDEMAPKIGKTHSRDSESLKKYIAEFEKKIETFSQKIQTLQGDVLFRSMTSCPSENRTSRQFDQLEHVLTLHETQIAEHNQRIQILGASSFDGTFIWKIDNYSQRFSEALSNKTPSLYSPPFYTSRFGYKLCARAYLNGDGMGKGNHLSLFISIMRGEYDAVLPWPFTRKITLKLLDQNKNVDVSETFMPDANSNSFQRPTSAMNVASGCPRFCAHSRLQTNAYIKDNAMFVKVIVG